MVDFLILFKKDIYLRAYTVAATAVTLGVSKKWVDNVLSHHQVDGVLQKKQGIARRVTPAGLLTLEIALHLGRSLGVPISRALDLAGRLIAAQGREVSLGEEPTLRARLDIQAFASALSSRVERALEITPTPWRGRPRYK